MYVLDRPGETYMRVKSPPASLKAYNVIVRGRVQGVGFRAFTRRNAMLLELRGEVANRPDGSVKAYIEGDKERLRQMIHLLNEGPSLARVEEVAITPVKPQGTHRTFEVSFSY